MKSRSLLEVRVKPGSRAPGISFNDGVVEVRVAAPARDGLANDAVLVALAKTLGRPRAALVLVRGATSRNKTFEIAGLTLDEALARIAGTTRGR